MSIQYSACGLTNDHIEIHQVRNQFGALGGEEFSERNPNFFKYVQLVFSCTPPSYEPEIHGNSSKDSGIINTKSDYVNKNNFHE